MFLQFGTYKFDGIKLPQSWSRSKETMYGQTPIIGSKPVVQQIGEKLEEIELGIFLSSDFCTPKTELDNLHAMRTKGVVSNLVDGSGTNYGKFVITAISEDVVTTLADGYITGITATLNLLEYNTADTVLKQIGKAVSTSKPVSELPLEPIKSNMQVSIETINQGATMSNQLASDVSQGQMSVGKLKKAQTNAQTTLNTLNSAKTQMYKTQKSVLRGANQVRDAINTVNNYVTNVKILTNRLQTATEKIQGIPGAVLGADSLQDYADLTKNAELITIGTQSLNVATAPLAAVVGSREST